MRWTYASSLTLKPLCGQSLERNHLSLHILVVGKPNEGWCSNTSNQIPLVYGVKQLVILSNLDMYLHIQTSTFFELKPIIEPHLSLQVINCCKCRIRYMQGSQCVQVCIDQKGKKKLHLLGTITAFHFTYCLWIISALNLKSRKAHRIS